MENPGQDPEKLYKEILRLCSNTTPHTNPTILSHLFKRVKFLSDLHSPYLQDLATIKIFRILRTFLALKEKALRTISLKILRYICITSSTFPVLKQSKIEHFIIRSFELDGKSEERLEACKLIKTWAELSPLNFPKSLCNSLIALSESENDELKEFGLEALRFLTCKNLPLVAWSGGIRVLINSVLDLKCTQGLSENIVMTISYLLNCKESREYLKDGRELARVFSVFTDYESGLKENEQEAAIKLGRKILVSMVRTWPGLIYVFANGLTDVITCLKHPVKAIIKEGILETIYEMVNINVDTSIKSYNLLNNYLAVLIRGLLFCGLYPALTNCALDKSSRVTKRARKLLKIVTKFASDLLPESPQVSLNLISGSEGKTAELVAEIANFARINTTSSDKTFLKEACDYIATDLGGSLQSSNKVLNHIYKQHFLNSLDDTQYLTLINKSQVSKEIVKWDWELIYEIISGPISVPLRFIHPQSQKFLKNIIGYFMPSKGLFSILPWHSSNFIKSRVGSLLINLLLSQEEGISLLSTTYSESFFVVRKSYMGELSDAIDEEINFNESKVESISRIFSEERVRKCMARDYFRWIGIFLANRPGRKLLKTYNIDNKLMKLADIEHLAQILATVMDFKEGSSQRFLVLMIQSKNKVLRIYAMEFLRALYRSGTYDLSWAIWVLKNQLHANDLDSVSIVLNLLDEICQYKENLIALIETGPQILLKLGEPGNKVLIRFLSSSSGVSYLTQVEYIQKELAAWHNSQNLEYARLIEEKVEQGLNSSKKSFSLTLTTPKMFQVSERLQLTWINKLPFQIHLESQAVHVELNTIIQLDKEDAYLAGYLENSSITFSQPISACLSLGSNFIDSKGNQIPEGQYIKCPRDPSLTFPINENFLACENNGVIFIFESINNVPSKLHKVWFKLQILPKGVPTLQIPRHIFGELGKTTAGIELLSKTKYIEEYCEGLMGNHPVLHKRAWIWALGHTGASNHGSSYLIKAHGITSIINTAENSPILSLRGTAVQALSLIARSSTGRSELYKHNWISNESNSCPIAVPTNAEKFFWVEKNSEIFPFKQNCEQIERIFESLELNDLEKEILKHVCFLGSLMNKSISEQFLRNLRNNAPMSFQNLRLFHAVMTAISVYSFKLQTRRVIHKLFERIHRIECLDELDKFTYI